MICSYLESFKSIYSFKTKIKIKMIVWWCTNQLWCYSISNMQYIDVELVSTPYHIAGMVHHWFISWLPVPKILWMRSQLNCIALLQQQDHHLNSPLHCAPLTVQHIVRTNLAEAVFYVSKSCSKISSSSKELVVWGCVLISRVS